MSKIFYILEKYPFYEGSDIIMISDDYDKVKKLFDKLVESSKTGYGYHISEYECGKDYTSYKARCKVQRPDWIEIDYDGNKRDIAYEM